MAKAFDMESLEAEFTEFLVAKKFRKTPERFAILQKAVDLNSHFEVDALHRAIEEDGYHVSRATVYNTVELLFDAGILRKNMFGSSATTYEIRRDNHIHLICKKCGKIREYENNHIASEILGIDVTGFSPESFSLTVSGICDDCKSDSSSCTKH